MALKVANFLGQGDSIAISRAVVYAVDNAVLRYLIQGPAQAGNLNAPRAVVHAAVIYVLRALVAERIPLNGGCLDPVDILIPEGSLLNPPPGAAVSTVQHRVGFYETDAMGIVHHSNYLPYFEEALKLATTAHGRAFARFPTVGWDIAVTDEGPLLVEMNISWGTEHDIPGESFLGETAYTECILAHMQRH